MRRFMMGLLLIAHGFAHALPGTQVIAGTTSWILELLGLTAPMIRWSAAVLWAFAMAGFFAAGVGVWGARPFNRFPAMLVRIATAASLNLLAFYWNSPWLVAGLAIDLAFILSVSRLHGSKQVTRWPTRRLVTNLKLARRHA